MLQTLHKPKFLMPDLLMYLNLLSLIQTRAAHINTLFSDSALLSTSQTHFFRCIHRSLLFVDLLREGHSAWLEDLGTFCFVCQREGAEFYSGHG